MTIQKLTETAAFIKAHSKTKPRIGIILGSGLGHFVQHMKIEASFSFDQIPHFIPPTVDGHSGNLILNLLRYPHSLYNEDFLLSFNLFDNKYLFRLILSRSPSSSIF